MKTFREEMAIKDWAKMPSTKITPDDDLDSEILALIVGIVIGVVLGVLL